MSERERAERLARAIDDLLRGDHSMGAAEMRPAGMGEEEIAALLRIARARLEAASAAAHTGIQYEGAIWHQVLHRLERRAVAEPESLSPDGVFAAKAPLDEEDDFGELADIVSLRRQMSARAAALAEVHRDAVWQQLRSRIRVRSRRRGLLGLLWRSPNAVPQFLRRGDTPVKGTDAGKRGLWPRLVALGAAAAIILAAIGPLPTTGLAGHPVAEFTRLAAKHIGITESAPPPTALGEVTRIEGIDASAADASTQLGFTIVEPASTPSGFEPTSYRVFPSTEFAGGMFVLTYSSTAADSASLAIYQQRASESDSTAQIGHAFDIILRDGTAATYVEGFWQPVDGEFVWSDGDGQALIFDRGGVRTSIQYRGPNRDPAFLFEIAESLPGH